MRNPKKILLTMIGVSSLVMEESEREFIDTHISKPFENVWKDGEGNEVNGTEFTYREEGKGGKRYLVKESLQDVLDIIAGETKEATVDTSNLNGLQELKDEARRVIDETNTESARIIADAQSQAAKIIVDAQSEAAKITAKPVKTAKAVKASKAVKEVKK